MRQGLRAPFRSRVVSQASERCPTLPLQNGDFRAWIRGIDNKGLYSNWSAVADFTVNAVASDAPVLISPGNFTTNNKPTFFWQGVANAKSYEILVKDVTNTAQPVVINVSTIPGTSNSYTAVTTLAPNRNYRWWVRVVTTNDKTSAWSQPLDFRVVSSDVVPEPSDSENTLGSTQLASVVVDAYAGGFLTDDVRSITAHPAGTIVQLSPEAAESFIAEPALSTDQQQPVADIDAVMEEFALDSFFTSDFDSASILPIAAGTPVVEAPTVSARNMAASDDETTVNAVTAGLLAAFTIMPRTVTEKDEKRKSQR